MFSDYPLCIYKQFVITEGTHVCPVPSDLCVFDSPCTLADIPLGKVVPDSDETMSFATLLSFVYYHRHRIDLHQYL